ncbi:hypothetical protein [uncultured Sphingomonas sp.]|uniref:hypothetical protein n=1 Tax=uncultured Sphingomonas sp. TaxID=158754 RepID=UPI0035C9FD60
MKPAVILPFLLLAGCAHSGGGGPSLAPRAAERQGFEEPAVVPAASTADPALDARLAALGARLDVAAKAFDADAATADKAAAAPGARTLGSDGWVGAQQAVAALDGRREQVTALATEVDGLIRERTETAGAPYPALDALVARAQAEGDRETARITALTAKLPQP